MKNQRLGILDWGIGGISIFRLVRPRIDAPVTYFSDTGVTPYGKMNPGELRLRLDIVIDLLRGRGVTHVVIGCNAASTAISSLPPNGFPIIGMIDSGVEASLKVHPRHLGVIGGRRTIASGIYRREFAKRGFAVSQRIAQPLSALIEAGDLSSPEVETESRRILAPLRKCSHILLACTHYPAITDILARAVPADVEFVDPAMTLADRVERWALSGRGDDEFLTTGEPAAMSRSASLAFDVQVPTPRHIPLT